MWIFEKLTTYFDISQANSILKLIVLISEDFALEVLF